MDNFNLNIQPLSSVGSLFANFIARTGDYGFFSISAEGIPADIDPQVLIKQQIRKYSDLRYALPAYTSSHDPYGDGYIRRFAARDSNYVRSVKSSSGFIYDFNQAPPGCQNHYENHGVNSALIVPIANSEQPDWKVRLVINCALDPMTLKNTIEAHNFQLCSDIRQLYLELMDQHRNQLDPNYLSGDSIHPKARRILELLAEGDSNKVIAGKLHLTEKGVDYHINNLRNILGAKNRPHLVCQAYKRNLL